METKEKREKLLAGMLALVGLLLVWTLATAGDLEPNSPPGPTMKTLDEIYNAAADVSQREGYMKYVELDPNSSYTFFTVPAGKQFVLLKLHLRYLTCLTVNDNLLINWKYFPTTDSYNILTEDLPDRCIVVDAGETLKAVNDSPSSTLEVTILGYFYDVP